MEIVKGSETKAGPGSFLIIGVEKSGKTSFIGTALRAARRGIVFACEEGTLKRLGGIENVDFVQAYVTKEDMKKAAGDAKVKTATDPEKKLELLRNAAESIVWRRVGEAQTDLLTTSHEYDLCGWDSVNYYQDLLLNHKEGVNGKTGYDLWREAKKALAHTIEQLIPMFNTFIATVHVKQAEDETVNREMFSAAIQGSYKDVIGGKFDAVMHSFTKPNGTGVDYLLQVLPDYTHKAGMRVPIGMEGLIKKELPNDYGKIMEMLKGGKK